MDPRTLAILVGAAIAIITAFAIAYISILVEALQRYNLARLVDLIPATDTARHEKFTRLTRRDDEFVQSCAIGRIISSVLHFCGWILLMAQDPNVFDVMDLVYAAGASVGALIVLAVIVPLLVVRQRHEQVVLSLLPTFAWLSLPLKPLTFISTVFRRMGAQIEGKPVHDSPENTFQQELAESLEEGEREGVLDEAEREMIHSVVELGKTPASKAMIPRTEMACADLDDGIDAALKLAGDQGHSRLPVFSGTRDKIVGVLHTRDVLTRLGELKQTGTLDLKAMLRPARYWPASKPLNELLEEMRRERVSIAILLDEYGGTAGLITIEDILERIVGDIRDEFDREEAKRHSTKIKPFAGDVAEADGDVDLDELNRVLEVSLPEGADYNSVGGYIQHALGRMPAVGESVTTDGLRLTVIDADNRRIKRVKLARVEPAAT